MLKFLEQNIKRICYSFDEPLEHVVTVESGSNSVEETLSKLRDLINSSTHKRKKLIDDRKKWLIVCSAMDVIGDTELAIKSYEDTKEKIDDGKTYLFIYGLLQSMYVQQDAVTNIRKTLNVPPFNKDEEEKLKYIREIRNDIIGHPTKRERGDVKRSNFITRRGLSLKSVTLIKSHFDKESGDKIVEIKPFDLIQWQREVITNFLNFVISSLKEQISKHR